MNRLRVLGIFLRNMYLLKRSVPRIFSLFVWVTVELFLWGFVTIWVRSLAGEGQAVDFVVLILSALVFWNLFVRTQQSFTLSFFEDVHAHNVMNVFAAPIKQREFVAGFAVLSVAQGLFGFFYVAALASVLYALNIWTLGFYLVPFFVLILVFGWVLGLFTTAVVLRFGPAMEVLAFFVPFLFLPFSAVYYPASIFPEFIQNTAQFLPTLHLFEGMRLVLTQNVFPVEHIIWATGLTIAYFVGAVAFFAWMVQTARKKGLIARLLAD